MCARQVPGSMGAWGVATAPAKRGVVAALLGMVDDFVAVRGIVAVV